jgi:hypothetical protein
LLLHAGAKHDPWNQLGRRPYLAEYSTPDISYIINMPSFLSQNQQEYPLSFFLSYLYTRKSKEKKREPEGI